MIRNFLFHRVNTVRDELWDPMDVKLFDQCIKYISSNYDVVLIEDLVGTPRISKKNKYACITFDDGYKGILEYAHPILKKYNCKCSIYVVTESIDTNQPIWTHLLEHSFINTNISKINLTYDFLPLNIRTKELKSKEERINYIKKLNPVLRALTHENRYKILNYILSTYSDVEIPKFMLSWDDLRFLKSEGHYIGSHTVSHTMLAAMMDDDEIKCELIDSARKIESELGHFPVSISYPIGSYNENVKILSKDVGYKMGLAVNQNMYNPKLHDDFEIPRIELYNEPWWKTKLRITNDLERVKQLIGYK